MANSTSNKPLDTKLCLFAGKSITKFFPFIEIYELNIKILSLILSGEQRQKIRILGRDTIGVHCGNYRWLLCADCILEYTGYSTKTIF